MADPQNYIHVSPPELYFGCDPEFFFAKDGKIIGAEKVLPADGKIPVPWTRLTTGRSDQTSSFVLDGVQVELNPRPHPCRANLGNEIRLCFQQLRTHLAKQKGIGMDFDAVVQIDQKELDSLCDKAKVLGCAPSKSLYGAAEVKVNAATLTSRSAGGHIHLGLPEILKMHPERLVKIMDVLVGNTCVLLDRNPANIERRKLYGRAGEYRVPPHGIEYRTLSNFWLKSYQLMSCVMGLARMSVSVLYHTEYPSNSAYAAPYKWDAEKALMAGIDMPMVVEAINTNDFKLAEKTFKVVRTFVENHGTYATDMALNRTNTLKFERFYKTIEAEGLEAWFPWKDPMAHWCNMPDGHGSGFESFLANTV